MPLDNAIDLSEATDVHKGPVMYDTYKDRISLGTISREKEVKNTESFDRTQRYPSGQFPKFSRAFVDKGDALYPARADITLKCPGDIPAYRLSNDDYDILLRHSSIVEPIVGSFSNPAPLIGNAGAAFGEAECFVHYQIKPGKVKLNDGDGR